ncbi:MAG: serine hydrolase [Planctomycetales bacterium]|nr:serine hydrolase [Planctomycetales bacterium]
MKRILILSALLLFSRGIICQEVSAEPTFAEKATEKFREATAGESSGIAVLVARDGKIVFQGGFGFAEIEKKEQVTPETKFRIGSISKQFTAAAVLRLAEEKKLSLDDSLAKFFPDFPNGDEIKVRQLLTHTSGIHSYTSKPEFISRVKDPIEPEKLIDWFRDDKPDFAPGQGFLYNNSAYFLAGEIVAKVSGKPFETYLRETFFEPLEMKDTGIFVNSAPPTGIARGYSLVNEKIEPALDWDMSWAGGAGALYSTVGDLFRWNEALFGGKVLKEETLKAATTPVELPPNVEGMSYGYGLTMLKVKRLPAVAHGGGLNGWSTYLLRLPDQHCTVVVLTNALPGSPKHSPSAIAHVLAEKLLVDEIAKLPEVAEDKTIDPKTLPDFVGRYDYKDAVMTISVDGDVLYSQITGQPKHRIYPKAKDTFFWKVADAEVVFLRDDKGQVTAARHTQNGNSFRAAKFAKDAIDLTAEQAESFVGEYRYGLLAVMTVTRDGSQLFAQLTGQPKHPIFPTSETEFEWRVVEAKVKFTKDKDGKVTKGTHTQNGNSFDVPKIK